MLSHVRLFATRWTVAHQSPLSMRFSRQEHWSSLPMLEVDCLEYYRVLAQTDAPSELSVLFSSSHKCCLLTTHS